jgi:hypothetical protein
MIRPLRQRHRHVLVALGIFLPAAFTIGIAARKPIPATGKLPPIFSVTSVVFESVAWKRDDLFAKLPVEVQLLSKNQGSGHVAVKLSGPPDFIKPDLLVYWVTGNSSVTDRPPDNAILLGTFASSPFPLLNETVRTKGMLVLYSLADNQIVDATKPFRFDDPTNQ